MILVFLFEINSLCGSSLGSSGRFEMLSNADFAALLSDPPRLPLPSQAPQFPARGLRLRLSFISSPVSSFSSLTNSPKSLCCLSLLSTDPCPAAFPDFARSIPLPGCALRSQTWSSSCSQPGVAASASSGLALISLCAPPAASFFLKPPSLHLHFSKSCAPLCCCCSALLSLQPHGIMEWFGLGF